MKSPISCLAFSLLAIVLGSVILSLPARAEWDLGGVGDDDFVNSYFGTTLVMTTSTQVANPDTGYWGDYLPTEFISNQEYLVGVINAQRVPKGQVLLDAATYPIAVGWETPLEDGTYQYHIDFNGVRPSEVWAVVTLLGGESKLLPGSSVSVRPLMSGYFSGYSSGSTKVTMLIGAEEVTLDAAQPISTALDQVNAMLRKRFGKDVPFTLSLTQDYNYDGAGTTNASAYLGVNLGSPEGYEGAVGG